MKKISNLFAIIYCGSLLMLISSCSEDKISISDNYTFQQFSIEQSMVLLDGISSVDDVLPLPDQQNFLLLGTTDNLSNDVFSCLIDSSLTVTQLETYGGNLQDFGNTIIKAPTSGFYLVASTHNNTIGASDYNLIRIDEDGREIWSRTYGTVGCDKIYSGIMNAEEEIVLVGGSSDPGNPGCSNFENLSVIVDLNGDTVATHRSLFARKSSIVDVAQLSNGEYAVLHISSNDLIENKLLISITDDLADLTDFTEVTTINYLFPTSEIISIDGGILLVTNVSNPAADRSDSDILLTEVSLNGTITNQLTIESDCKEEYNSFLTLADGSLLIAGRVSVGQGNVDALICKVDFPTGVQWCNQYNYATFSSPTTMFQFNAQTVEVLAYSPDTDNENTNLLWFRISAENGELLE